MPEKSTVPEPEGICPYCNKKVYISLDQHKQICYFSSRKY